MNLPPHNQYIILAFIKGYQPRTLNLVGKMAKWHYDKKQLNTIEKKGVIMMQTSTVVDHFLSYYGNKQTRKIYSTALNKFFRSIECNPDTYFISERDYELDIRTFANCIKDNAPKTFYSYVGVVRQLFMRQKIEIDRLVWRDMKLIKKGKHAITRDRPPSIPELQLMLSHADLKMKVLLLSLLSSGMRIGELTKITVNDIDFNSEPTKIYLRGSITKTGNARICFISDEATVYLQEWLKKREHYLELAVRMMNLPGKSKNGVDNRAFPFTVNAARSAFLRLLRLTNLTMRDSETNRYVIHLHTFRKFFRSKLALVIPQDIVEVLMGHEGYLSSSYIRYTEEELAEYYLQGMSAVTVFGDNNSRELKQLEEEIKRRDEKIASIENRMGEFDRKMQSIKDMAELMKKMKKPDLRL
jgi:integrase